MAKDKDAPATVDDAHSESEQSIKPSIKQEIAELREFSKGWNWAIIKEGDWFNLLLQKFLKSHSEQVSVDYFRHKYPGLPSDAIADRLIASAVKASTLAGGVSGASVSLATLAAPESLGLSITGGLAALVGEMLYTTRLQMRLIFDMSLLYHKELNIDDPEDLMDIFAMATGVKTAETGGKVIKGLAPEAARVQVRSLIHGSTPAIQAAAKKVLGPNIAKRITQRAILRTAVPIIGIGISSGWNYLSTRSIAKLAKAKFRAKGVMSEELQRLSVDLHSIDELTGSVPSVVKT